MLYSYINNIFNCMNWSVTTWMWQVGLAILFLLMTQADPRTARQAVAIFFCFEFLYACPWWACSETKVFVRVPGTENACSAAQYSAYLKANLGTSHLYMWVMWFGLFTFMIFGHFKRFKIIFAKHEAKRQADNKKFFGESKDKT